MTDPTEPGMKEEIDELRQINAQLHMHIARICEYYDDHLSFIRGGDDIGQLLDGLEAILKQSPERSQALARSTGVRLFATVCLGEIAQDARGKGYHDFAEAIDFAILSAGRYAAKLYSGQQ